METLNQIEIEKALLDIRKAHRLLFEYQHRIVDIMHFIQDKLKLPSYLTGNKLIFETIHNTRGGYGTLNVNNIWAWDFIYGYIFEFYLGNKICYKGSDPFVYDLSIIEVSDTGFFESQIPNKDLRKTNSYVIPEEAATFLIFMIQTKPKETGDNIWQNTSYIQTKTEEIINNKKEDFIEEKNNITFYAKKYNVTNFFTQLDAEKSIQEFIELVKMKTGIDISFQ